MIEFVKKYKGSLLATIIVVGLGSIAIVTSLKVGQKQPVAPNAPQRETLAAGTSCTLSFPVGKAETKEGLRCVGLSAAPLSGPIPLTVTFYAHGYDLNDRIVETNFAFGDGEQQTVKETAQSSQISQQSLSYTYQRSGTYDARVTFTNSKGEKTITSDLCRVRISVTP